MEHPCDPTSYKQMLVSDPETESDDNLKKIALASVAGGPTKRDPSRMEKNLKRNRNGKPKLDRDALVELAKKYQKHMKNNPIPLARLNEIVVFNWKNVATTLKRMYGQPLHYLTYKLCAQWDQSMFTAEDEEKPLNAILTWRDAEDTIWKIEAVHRTCTSPVYLAMLWVDDPGYQAIVDEVIPSP